ncbi:TetR/AcrR family transcriptional regulator [Amycolatopsis sp. NPDC005232]|uniref:TetR/AcrR family transcriptional regulator n=1 Tax=Amycolatopsis sp. NPDC005232 TaxID=3157027 RepID=UPI0033B9E66C
MAGVRQFDEREALSRALDVFTDRGFRATSMLDLATGTGVQRGSLYNAYGGKEEIFLRAFGEYTADFLTGASAALDRPTKRAALLSFFDYCIETFTAGTPAHGCLSTRTAIEAATESPRAESAVRALLDELETLVYAKLSTLDDGVESPVDLHGAARLVVSTTRGLAVMERVRYEPGELREIAETLVTSLFGR